MTNPTTQIDPAERWTVLQDGRLGKEWNRQIVRVDAPGMRIACMSYLGGKDDGLDAARAALMAAAPELLAAIELLIEDA